MASQQQGRKISDQVSEQEKKELDKRAAEGETVVPGGTRGKSLEAQERLAEGIYIFILLFIISHVRN